MKSWLVILGVLILTACGGGQSPADTIQSAPAAVQSKMMADRVGSGAEQSLTEISEPAMGANNGAASNDAQIQRFIAMRHYITVETAESDMQGVFDATVARCEELKCQILSANIIRKTQYAAPSASLTVRVPPRSLEVFLDNLAKSADLIQHQRDSEDKTDAVIDTEARIKNLTDLRDRLREMLSKRTERLKDLIEVERELANTQAQLDSLAAQRKVLAQETEMVLVNINFQAKQSIRETSFFAPVAQAWDEAGRVMMQSIAAIISFVAASLPWLIIGIPLILLVRKFWRKIKAKVLP